MNTLQDFKVGDRIEMHPATDLWMMGARFGYVVLVGTKYVSVSLDKIGTRRIQVRPENLLHVA